MYDRSMAHVLLAATVVETDTLEDAAIVGAIVRTLLRIRRWNGAMVCREAAEWAQLDCTPQSIAPITRRFHDAYQHTHIP